jgi:DNA-binding response OmpR family regulator
MHDFARLLRQAASEGYLILVPSGQQLAPLTVPSTHSDADVAALRLRLDLTPGEARALLALAQHGHAGKDELQRAISGCVSGAGVVQIVIHRLRAKLKNHDIGIKTIHGVGYALTETARDTVHALLDSSGEKAGAAAPPHPISPAQ